MTQYSEYCAARYLGKHVYEPCTRCPCGKLVCVFCCVRKDREVTS